MQFQLALTQSVDLTESATPRNLWPNRLANRRVTQSVTLPGSIAQLRRRAAAAAAWVLGSLPGCIETTTTESPLAVASIDMNPSGPVTVIVGQTLSLTATPKSASGLPMPARSVEWSSSNTSVASVSSAGVVSGVSSGSATISARSGTATSDLPVTVKRTFALVIGGGPAFGQVSGPAGLSSAISCTIALGVGNGTCTATYVEGTQVTLTANAATNSTFAGWAGACSGATCTVTMTSNLQVTANFSFTPIIDFNTVLQPGSAAGTFLGPSPIDRGYVIDVSPSEPWAGTSFRQVVQPESNGTEWIDVLRLFTAVADPPLNVNVRVYDASVLPVAGTFVVTLLPGVSSGTILGPSSLNRSYVVEITPTPTPVPDGTSIPIISVRPEWNGTTWNDVLRLQTNAQTPNLPVSIRVYDASVLPLATQFTTTLQPGVLHGFSVGASSDIGGYIVEVSPVSSVNAVIQEIRLLPEFPGTWMDVLRLQTRPQDPPLEVHVRIRRMGG